MEKDEKEKTSTPEVEEQVTETPEEQPEEVKVSYRDQVNSLFEEKHGTAKEDIITSEMLKGHDYNKIIIISIVIIFILIGVFYLSKKPEVRNFFTRNKEEENPETEVININDTYGIKVEKKLTEYQLPSIVEDSCTTGEVDGISWNYCLDSNDNAINVYAVNDLSQDVTIPSSIDGHKVIAVGMRNSNRQLGICDARYNCRNITEVTVPDGVLYIEKYFLMNAYNVERVTLPNSVKYIGDNAFYDTKKMAYFNSDTLGEFVMPDDLEYYGTSLFVYNKYVTSFKFPERIDYINSYTFDHCEGFKKLVIDGQYKYIMPGAFANNSNLTSVTIKDGVYVVSGFASNPALKEVEIADSVKYLYEKSFANDTAITSFTYNGKLNYLGPNIFSGTDLDINKYLTLKNLDLIQINIDILNYEEQKKMEEEKREREEKERRAQEAAEKERKDAEDAARKQKQIEEREKDKCLVTDLDCGYEDD